RNAGVLQGNNIHTRSHCITVKIHFWIVEESVRHGSTKESIEIHCGKYLAIGGKQTEGTICSFKDPGIALGKNRVRRIKHKAIVDGALTIQSNKRSRHVNGEGSKSSQPRDNFVWNLCRWILCCLRLPRRVLTLADRRLIGDLKPLRPYCSASERLSPS